MILDRLSGGALIDRLAGLRPLVVGDLMLDEYLFGEVERISPEAPVPVVRLRREKYRLGGAGNVAANARAVGAAPILVGVLGDDDAGRRFRTELGRRDIEAAGIATAAGATARPTTHKTRVVAHSQQVVRFDREELAPLTAALEEQVLGRALDAIAEASVVVLSDYDKGCLTTRVLKELLAAASGRGVTVVVDPKAPTFDRYQPVTALTPNHHEAARAAEVFDGGDNEAVERAGRRILENQEAAMVLITRGEAGMSLVERGGAATHLKTVAREVYDVTGAGDTVCTTFALALAAGARPEEAADLSNHAAGVVVGKVGTATASPDELKASLPE